MHRLDDFVREKIYQRVADWVTGHFERSCFWLAGQAALLVSCAAVACGGIQLVEGNFDPMATFGAVVALILAPLFYKRAEREEVRWLANENALRLDTPGGEWNRMMWLTMAPFELTLLVFTILDGAIRQSLMLGCIFAAVIASLSHEYFMICRPPPPRRRRAVQLAMGTA